MRSRNGDFRLFTYLNYFGKYGCYNLVSEQGSVPALTWDGDLLGRGFDSVLDDF